MDSDTVGAGRRGTAEAGAKRGQPESGHRD